MKENTVKIIISAIAAGLSAYFRVMAIPIVILVLVMIIDYITGMWKAWNRGELSSRVGLKGLFKKVGYIFVVVVPNLGNRFSHKIDDADTPKEYRNLIIS